MMKIVHKKRVLSKRGEQEKIFGFSLIHSVEELIEQLTQFQNERHSEIVEKLPRSRFQTRAEL